MAKGKYEYWLTPEDLLKLEGWARDGLMDELKQERVNAIAEYTDIHRAIRKMEDEEEKEVLERKYLMRQSWDVIAEGLCVSRRTTIRIHGNALMNFEIPKVGTP